MNPYITAYAVAGDAVAATIVFSASSTFFSCFVISNTSISPYSLLAQLLNSEFT